MTDMEIYRKKLNDDTELIEKRLDELEAAGKIFPTDYHESGSDLEMSEDEPFLMTDRSKLFDMESHDNRKQL